MSPLPLVTLLVVALAICACATPIIRRIAVTHGKLDNVHDSRKIHGRPVPRLGGLAIAIAMYGSVAIGLLIPPCRDAVLRDGDRMVGLAIAGLLVVALGVYDDLYGAGARTKLAFQLAAGVLLYFVGFRVAGLSNPFTTDIALGPLSLPVTVLWIAGVSNAVNLIDGLDGLAGTICLAGAVAAFSIGAHAGDVGAMLISAAAGGAVLGFLIYNVSPASIFMGDTGSLFLGTVLAALAIRPQGEPAQNVSLLSMGLALGVPLADTCAAMVRRAIRGNPICRADREHIHHRLLDLGLPQRRVLIAIGAMTALLTAAGVHVACGTRGRGFVLLLALSGIAFAVCWLGVAQTDRAGLRARRRNNRERLRAIRDAAARLRIATRLAEVIDEVSGIAPAIEAAAVRLLVTESVAADVQSSAAQPSMRFPINPAQADDGALEVVWRDRRSHVDRDTEIAVEILCQSVSRALQRIERMHGPAATYGAPAPDMSDVTCWRWQHSPADSRRSQSPTRPGASRP